MSDNEELFDALDRPIVPSLINTEKDGSGTWYFFVVDDEGQLKVTFT